MESFIIVVTIVYFYRIMPNAKRLQRALKNPAAFQHQIERRIFYENRKRRSLVPTIPRSESFASPFIQHSSGNTRLFAPLNQTSCISPSFSLHFEVPIYRQPQSSVEFDSFGLFPCGVTSQHVCLIRRNFLFILHFTT